MLMSQHNSMVLIINAALGGESSEPRKGALPPGARDLGAGHNSVEDAVAAITAAMTI
jgi:hypothetical protein